MVSRGYLPVQAHNFCSNIWENFKSAVTLTGTNLMDWLTFFFTLHTHKIIVQSNRNDGRSVYIVKKKLQFVISKCAAFRMRLILQQILK